MPGHLPVTISYEFLQRVAQHDLSVPVTSVEQASLLGKRTAEMHLALSGEKRRSCFSLRKPIMMNMLTGWLITVNHF
jgi:hypothetical protein